MKEVDQYKELNLNVREDIHSNNANIDTSCGLNADSVYKRILYNLEEKEVYLNPKINLVNFSLLIGTNTTYLSSVVNKLFGMNFKTLINKYRVQKAKNLLHERECSLEELIKLCGFSSRSILYTSFQREVGVPPSHYRHEVLHLDSKIRKIGNK